jgi:hypothetical protein
MRKIFETIGLLKGEADGFVLMGAQKTELLRRKEAFLANPTIAEPWEGTPEKIRRHLHARRAQKAASNHR